MEFLRGYPARTTRARRCGCKRTGQTERAIRHFWEPVLVGALNDSFCELLDEVCGAGLS